MGVCQAVYPGPGLRLFKRQLRGTRRAIIINEVHGLPPIVANAIALHAPRLDTKCGRKPTRKCLFFESREKYAKN